MWLPLTLAWGAVRCGLAGPLGGAITVVTAAGIVVGAAGLGLAWLRADARGDEKVACDARQYLAQLASARAEAAALHRANEERAREIERRALEAAASADRIAALEVEKEEIRRAAEAAESDAAAARLLALPDDAWLRGTSSRPAAASGARRH